MRTTLTIDDDLIREMKKKAHDTGSPFKKIVNAALRAGLQEMGKPIPLDIRPAQILIMLWIWSSASSPKKLPGSFLSENESS